MELVGGLKVGVKVTVRNAVTDGYHRVMWLNSTTETQIEVWYYFTFVSELYPSSKVSLITHFYVH